MLLPSQHPLKRPRSAHQRVIVPKSSIVGHNLIQCRERPSSSGFNSNRPIKAVLNGTLSAPARDAPCALQHHAALCARSDLRGCEVEPGAWGWRARCSPSCSHRSCSSRIVLSSGMHWISRIVLPFDTHCPCRTLRPRRSLGPLASRPVSLGRRLVSADRYLSRRHAQGGFGRH